MSGYNLGEAANFSSNPFVSSLGGLRKVKKEDTEKAVPIKKVEKAPEAKPEPVPEPEPVDGKGERDPETGLYVMNSAKFALKKIHQDNKRAVILTVNSDDGICMVTKSIPFTDEALSGDLAKARDMCKAVPAADLAGGLVAVIRPTKSKVTQVCEIQTAGMKHKAKMSLHNCAMWVRVNGDCHAFSKEIHLGSIDELEESLFK